MHLNAMADSNKDTLRIEKYEDVKDNMKKRRMLFSRDQAERKDLVETSVNNTMIESSELSGLHSKEVSTQHSRQQSST